MAKNELPSNSSQGVFFDVDGTLAATNVIQAYLDFRLRLFSPLRRWIWLAGFVPKLGYYALLDRIDRARFNEAFFRNYTGVRHTELEEWSRRAADGYWKRRLYHEGLREMQQHRQRGRKIILISGGLHPVIEPLTRMFKVDELVAVQPELDGDYFTGKLMDGPLSGRSKALAIEGVAKAMSLDLSQSYAYADSYADRYFLESVGHPVAVNPDGRLRRLARTRGWPIRVWRSRSSATDAKAGSVPTI